MGELAAELPAVDGRPAFTLTRVMEGEEGNPMNIPEWRFDIGPEGRSTGDPSRPCDGGLAEAAACSCWRCCDSVATRLVSIEPRRAPAEEGPDEWLSTDSVARFELERERPPLY